MHPLTIFSIHARKAQTTKNEGNKIVACEILYSTEKQY